MRTTGKCTRGMTLVEILIAMAIFSLFLYALCNCVVVGYHSYTIGTREASLFRSASIGMDLMARELRQCKGIYFPDSAILSAGYFPVKNSSAPLVIKRYEPSASALLPVAFTLDTSTHRVERLIYDPAFEPASPSTWSVTERRVIAESVQSLSFTFSLIPAGKEFIKVQLLSFPDPAYFPVETRVSLMKGY